MAMFRKDVSRLLIQAKPVLDDIVECESYSAAGIDLDNTTKSLVTKLKSSFLTDSSRELPHHNLHEFSEQYVRPTKELLVEDERELILSSSPRELINWNFTPRNKNTIIERSNELMNSIGNQKRPGPVVPSKVLGLKNVMPERRYKSELMDDSTDMPVKKLNKIEEKKKTLQNWPDKIDPKLTHERAQIEEVQSSAKKAGPPALFDRGGERFASKSVSEIRESPGHYRVREYIRPKTHCMVRPFDKPDKGKHPLDKRREILAERSAASMPEHLEVEVAEDDDIGELMHMSGVMQLDRSRESLGGISTGGISTGGISSGKIGEEGSDGDESYEDNEESNASVLEEMPQHRNFRRSQQSMMSSSVGRSSFKKKEAPPRKTKAELEEEHKNRVLKKLEDKEKRMKQKMKESISRPVEAAAYGDRRAAAMFKEKRQNFFGQFRQLQGLPEKKNPFAYHEETPTMFKARKRGYKVDSCESWKQQAIGYQPQDISLAGSIRKATKADWKIPRSRQVVNPMSIGQQAASSIEFFWSRAQKAEG